MPKTPPLPEDKFAVTRVILSTWPKDASGIPVNAAVDLEYGHFVIRAYISTHGHVELEVSLFDEISMHEVAALARAAALAEIAKVWNKATDTRTMARAAKGAA